jgi:DNA polymerase I-like protein with 3'-5' exonuclease and polymerase domains
MPIYFGDKQVTKELFRQQLIDSPPSVIGIDIETISVKERLPLTFAIAISPTEAWTFECYPTAEREIELIAPLLANPNIKKVIHNAPFDLRSLPLIPYLENCDRSNLADTLVMARLLGYSPADLVSLASIVGRTASNAGDVIGGYGGKTMLDVPPERRASKCAEDAEVALQLYHSFLPKINADYFSIEMKVIPILIDMGLKGIMIDQAERERLNSKVENEISYYKGICDLEGFNPASPQQVGYVLAKRGNWLPFTKSKKNLKTDEETLEFLDDPLASIILSYRKMSKAKNTYLDPLEKEIRFYTEYYLDTDVGRTNSRNRNIQNIPDGQREPYINMRSMLIPDSGVFTNGDFSQEHLYILMYFSGDRAMKRVYEEGEYGGDIHQYAAETMEIPRKIAKTVNYAVIYGADAKTISAQSKIRDLGRCQQFLNSWFKAFPDASEWIREAETYGIRNGWSLPTLFGRSIRLPDEFNYQGILDINAKKRKAVNYPILGSDGEVIKRGLILCKEKKLPLSLQVHDSIMCDGDVEFPVEQLEHIAPVRIPFKVSKSERWE